MLKEQFTLKHQVHYGDRDRQQTGISRCPCKEETGWFTRTHSIQKTYAHRSLSTCGISTPSGTEKWGFANSGTPAKTICDTESIGEELQHLKKTFRKNGYSERDISLALNSKRKQKENNEKPTATALMPYQQSTSNKISRLLAKYIRTIHVPAKKTCHMLRPVKDDPGLKLLGVYGIPCECGKTYIGQTNRTIETRRKEHMRHLRLGQPD
jgi:hypothetical protein